MTYIYCPTLKYALGTDAVDKCWRHTINDYNNVSCFCYVWEKYFCWVVKYIHFFRSHTLRNELYFRFHSFISSICWFWRVSFFILRFRKVFCPCWYFSGFYLTFFSCFASFFSYCYPFFYSFSFSFFCFLFYIIYKLYSLKHTVELNFIQINCLLATHSVLRYSFNKFVQSLMLKGLQGTFKRVPIRDFFLIIAFWSNRKG